MCIGVDVRRETAGALSGYRDMSGMSGYRDIAVKEIAAKDSCTREPPWTGYRPRCHGAPCHGGIPGHSGCRDRLPDSRDEPRHHAWRRRRAPVCLAALLPQGRRSRVDQRSHWSTEGLPRETPREGLRACAGTAADQWSASIGRRSAARTTVSKTVNAGSSPAARAPHNFIDSRPPAGGRHRDVAQLDSAPALGAGGRRFESCHLDDLVRSRTGHGLLAQLVARSPEERESPRSSRGEVTPRWCNRQHGWLWTSKTRFESSVGSDARPPG